MTDLESAAIRCRVCLGKKKKACERCFGSGFVLVKKTLVCGHEVWLRPDCSGLFNLKAITVSFDGVLVIFNDYSDLVCWDCSGAES